MATKNRGKVLEKLHRVLRKHYKPQVPNHSSVLDCLVFACCLEDASYADAQKAIENIHQEYFDYNELRVATVRELSQGVLAHLPDPTGCAERIHRALQELFETRYSFDLEWLKKEKLGRVSKFLEEKLQCSPFVTAYVVQNAVGGHAIPVDRAAWGVFQTLGLVSDKDEERLRVPGLERAISKSKGPEFSSLLHQFAVAWAAKPNSNQLRAILEEVEPTLKAPAKAAAKKTTKAKTTKTTKTAKRKAAKTKTTKTKKKKRTTPRKPR